MARRILVVTTAESPQADVERVVREHGGEDAELHVIAPASKISWLDRWTNDEDAARAEAAERAEAAADAAPADAEPHVGDVDPVKAIEDGLRQWPADEVVVLTAPSEQATWIERNLGEDARERFDVPVTALTTG
jgi:hypothetical protein